jgi:hypothetical protein
MPSLSEPSPEERSFDSMLGLSGLLLTLTIGDECELVVAIAYELKNEVTK